MDITQQLETGALIAHLISRYHEVHRQQFPEAVRLARRVEAVHAEHPAVPVGLSQHLLFMFDDLELHQQQEELMLFPMMGRGVVPPGPIACMEEEHDDVVVQLETLARLTTDFTPPEGACGSWRTLYALCREIDTDLREHVTLENDVLFRRFS
ncbi:hemerythrin domain-containing protein [Caulobacter sp. RHG1]|uniref:hemerythrin domain-containing protein n=1 Tax=Caulobacter sp. (strain RHG1) TaxID=2545762 RepID=UPI001552CE39|nr:hemerythrin domain-containing protein [Caulobacter sp. RHG1]NQE61299.1 Repair of Iron Centers di-iron protein [Caulobacter sp. RHG1]